MKAGRKMDYLGMLGFSCIFLGGSMLIGLLAWLGHCTWIEREERREREAIRRMEDRYYDEMKQGAVQYVESLYSGKVDQQ